jgi:tetratricopeptide (TPR) repeat protein
MRAGRKQPVAYLDLPESLLMKRTLDVKYYIAAAVSLITFIVYLPALRNEFVMWDDNRYVLENMHIRSWNAAFFKWAFFDFYASNWHPLTWLSHALDYAVWGLNPLGHHLANNILHAVNTFLVVLLTMHLIRMRKETSGSIGPPEFLTERTILIAAGMTGLLFGLHPLHVESVAWVAERKDLLCALFFLLSIFQYSLFVRSTSNEPFQAKLSLLVSNKHYCFSLGSFALALMSKPMAVTLPVVLLLLDRYPFFKIQSLKTFRSALIGKLPFIVLSLISSLITVSAQQHAMVPMDRAPMMTRVLVAIQSLAMYLWEMIWPLNLEPLYPYPKAVSLLSFTYLFPIVFVIAISVACLSISKSKRFLPTAWAYYVVTLLPVIGLVQVGPQSMADRYTYLPSLGPFLVMGLGAAWTSTKMSAVKRGGLIVRLLSAALALVIFAAAISITIKQIGLWKNGIIFWDYVIEKEPGRFPFAYCNRGVVLKDMGRFDEAIRDYDKAIALNPSFDKAFYDRAVAFNKIGRVDRALADFDRAITLDPLYAPAYSQRGSLYLKMGVHDKAVSDYNKAISLDPLTADAFFNLGVFYGRSGSYEIAINHLSKAISINPDNADYYSNRGAIYSLNGQRGLALDDLNKAIALNPDIGAVYYNRGVIYLNTERRVLALSDFHKACGLGDKDGCKGVQLLTRVSQTAN